MYSADVLALFCATPGSGRPHGPGWVTAEAREPLTGTHVRWHLAAVDRHITGALYEVRGCPHTIAAAALVAQQVLGRPVVDLALDMRGIAHQLQCDIAKLGRLFVIEDAILRAAHILEARPSASTRQDRGSVKENQS